jgi:tetratricopeptide (TPR) repeat protein
MRSLLAATCVAVSLSAVATRSEEGRLPLAEVSLDGLEPAVVEQLGSLRDLVLAAVHGEGVSAGDLGERVGELARHYHAYGLVEAAERSYRMARDLAPGDFRWGYLLGYLLQREGRLAEAVDLYEWSVSTLPQATPAWFRLGEAYRDLGRGEAAEGAFHQVLLRDPTSAAAEAALAGLALSRGEAAEAVVRYERALGRVPEANLLYYPLAQAHRALGDLERARELLARRGTVGVRVADPVVDALAGLTTGSRIHLLRGQAAHRAGHVEAAAAQFTAAVEADPESVPARVNLAASLAALGRAGEAIEELREAIRLAPANATARFNLGRLLDHAGDPAAAALEFEAAARHEPRDPEIRYLWAEALARAGEWEYALVRYREAIELGPPGELARLGEAEALASLGRHAEALARLEEARYLLPRSDLVARALARMLAAESPSRR